MDSNVEEMLECVANSSDLLNFCLEDEAGFKVFKKVGNNELQEIDSDTNFEIRDEEIVGSDEDCEYENMDEVLVHIQLL